MLEVEEGPELDCIGKGVLVIRLVVRPIKDALGIPKTFRLIQIQSNKNIKTKNKTSRWIWTKSHFKVCTQLYQVPKMHSRQDHADMRK